MDQNVLWETYEPWEWAIDRMGNMEFLDDQLFGEGDTLSPAFQASVRVDLFKCGFQGYVI